LPIMLSNSMSPSLRALLISLVIAAALVVFAVTSAEPVLRVSLIPDETPNILRRKFKPLSDYLEKKIGMKIEFRPMASEDTLVEALAANKLDMVWFGGFNFIQAKLRSNDLVIPIVQRAEDAQTRSVFITAHNSIIKLDDLKDKTFTFGLESSTSDHLMPRAFLLAANIDPDTDMKHVDHSGTHEALVAGVAGGKADAGVLNEQAWERMLANGKADPKVLHVFYITPGYFDFNWTARADMDENLRQKLIDAFLSLNENIALDKEILNLQRASRFVSNKAENYSVIEEMARSAGLLKQRSSESME